jgi:hypothetical protein
MIVPSITIAMIHQRSARVRCQKLIRLSLAPSLRAEGC